MKKVDLRCPCKSIDKNLFQNKVCLFISFHVFNNLQIDLKYKKGKEMRREMLKKKLSEFGNNVRTNISKIVKVGLAQSIRVSYALHHLRPHSLPVQAHTTLASQPTYLLVNWHRSLLTYLVNLVNCCHPIFFCNNKYQKYKYLLTGRKLFLNYKQYYNCCQTFD